MTKDTFLKIVDRKAKKLGIQKYTIIFVRTYSYIGQVNTDINEMHFILEILSSCLRRDFVEACIDHELEHLKNPYMCDGYRFEAMLKKKYPKYARATGWAKRNRETILADVFKFVPCFY